jgi:Domain of unknown function (DUF4421)
LKAFGFLLTVVFVFGHAFALSCLAQSDSSRRQMVREFPKQIFIGPVIKHRAVSFQLMNAVEPNRKIVFRPNRAYSAGLRLNLFGLAVEGSVAIPIAEKNLERFGTSQVSDFLFNTMSRKWMADFTRQRYSGFYFERSWLPLTFREVHPQRPDIEVKNAAVNFTYIFNNARFSIRAPFQFTERQTRSGGSFLLGFNFSRVQVRGSSDIIGLTDQAMFGDGGDARLLSLAAIGFLPGYSYNVVFKDYFFNVTALAGPAHYWISFKGDTGPRHYDIDMNLSTSFRAGIGYNGEQFFYGLSFGANGIQSRWLDTQFSSSVNTFRLVAGMRFMEKGFLTKRVSDFWKPNLKAK